jgi:DNA-directed RNA polymerase subunit RPC12/RpoP
MPVYIPEREIKVKCPKCGKEVKLKVGGYGDCYSHNISDLVRLGRDLFEDRKCPACGSKIKIPNNFKL